jgi:hypothetical protein
MKLEFSWQISENIQIPNFMKILPVGVDLFYADGRMDRHDEADSRFLQFAKALNNIS